VKEDVLEQVVDDYLQHLGYFTRHNVRFRPDEGHADYVFDEDKSSSDIDVIGYHPEPRPGVDRVIVVSCKSKQDGFNPTKELTALRKTGGGGKRRSSFRELWVPKWNDAFRETISRITGETVFAYKIAVTRLTGNGTADEWAADQRVAECLRGCSFGFLTFEEMWTHILWESTTEPASSQIAQLAQMYKSARLPIPPAKTQDTTASPVSEATANRRGDPLSRPESR
jgi:hypothetical protein